MLRWMNSFLRLISTGESRNGFCSRHLKYEYGRDQKDANEAVETVSKKVNKAKKDIKSHTEGELRCLNALSDHYFQRLEARGASQP